MVFVNGFYYLHNVVESLLNVKEMPVGLVRATVHLNGVECSLYAILDESPRSEQEAIKDQELLQEVSKIMSLIGRRAKTVIIHLIMTSPGGVGYRDVPYKNRNVSDTGGRQVVLDIGMSHIKPRDIYVLPLPRLHAQVAVAGQLADYVSIQGKNDGPMFLFGGGHRSEYDSHNVLWNFRGPMLQALKCIAPGDQQDGMDNMG
uniref:Bm9186 n=1 Tax=Brugia malayi TaxID=6279 RepID=A0A1I9GDC1_BRUMA|nr:Bm9186 [Brugia malayi]